MSLEAKSYPFGTIYEVPLELAVLKLFSFHVTGVEKKEPLPSKEDATMGKRGIIALMLLGLLAFGSAAPVLAQNQDGLVNVVIGDVTILEEVDIALAANVVANVCALVVADVLVLAQQVDATGVDFVCRQRGTGRSVAITDN
jgi:hypothetical protein